MNRFLLDTNVAIALMNGEKGTLPDALIAALDSEGGQLSMSVASVWEVAIKVRLGKLRIPFNLQGLEAFANATGAALLPIKFEHAIEEISPWPATNDPFDRLLLAQCEVEGLKLLTTDKILAGHRLSYRARH